MTEREKIIKDIEMYEAILERLKNKLEDLDYESNNRQPRQP